MGVMSFALKLNAVEQAEQEAAAVSEAADSAEVNATMVSASLPDCSELDGYRADDATHARHEESQLEEDALPAQPENGEIQRPNGAVYSGQVLKGFASGRGKQKWPSGAAYDGEWLDDTMQGLGTLTTPDGAEYVGAWLESRQHGHGKYIAPDRGCYEGQWSAGKMHGKGIYQWPDGAVFEGQFSQGEKCGEGVLRYANGSMYEGPWLDSKQHGSGVFTTKDGRSRRGEWKDGTRSRWLDDVVPENPRRQPSSPQCNFEIEQPVSAARTSMVGSTAGQCTERCTRSLAACVVM